LPSIAPGDIVNRRAFVTKTFARSLRRAALSERDLCVAMVEMTSGLVDANLGGDLFAALQKLTGVLLKLGAAELARELEIGNLTEIRHEAKSHTQ
jgi:hypothetical protein